jgi:hypothetical protein
MPIEPTVGLDLPGRDSHVDEVRLHAVLVD